MSHNRITIMKNDYFRFEDKEYDIPFYNGNPKLDSSKTIALLLGLCLTFCIPFIQFGNLELLKAILSCGIPLIAVWYALDGNLSEIFRKPKKSDIKIIIIGLICVFLVMFMTTLISKGFGIPSQSHEPYTAHPIITIVSTIIQLVGEELFKFIGIVLPMIFTYKYLGRKGAIIVGIIVSQLIFSIAHISAYGSNIADLIFTIGIGSIVFPLIYVKTKNIAVSYLVHLIWDFIGILPVIFGAAALLF